MGWGLASVLRASLRAGWRPLVGLALLIGMAGGALLTGVEASRRTDTAFDRMVEATNAWDVLVNPDRGTASPLTFDMIADLPMVEQAGRYDGVYMAPVHVGGFDELDEGFLVGASDGVAGYEIGGPANLQGRLPDPDAVDEVFLSARAAELNDLEVGDHYVGRILSDELFVALEEAVSEEEALALLNSDDFGERVELEIVGTGAFFDEVVVDSGFSTGSMMVTPAFWEAYDEPTAGFYGAFVTLRPGVEVDDFRAAVEATVPEETIAFQTRRSIEAQAERAIRPQVAALQVFTLVAGLIGLVIVAQAISRRLQLDAITYAPLRALGLTERQRAALALARTAVAATVGGLLAVAIAVAASPIAPVGVARDAEPTPGFRVEWAVVLGGAGLVVATVMAIAVWPAIASTRVREPRRQRASASALGGGRRLLPVRGRGHPLRPRSRSRQRPHPVHAGGCGHGGRPGRGHADLRRQPRQLHRLAAALRHAVGRGRERGGRHRGGGRGRPSPRGRRGVRRRGRGLRAADTGPGRARRHLPAGHEHRPVAGADPAHAAGGSRPGRPTTRWPWGRSPSTTWGWTWATPCG